MTSEAVRKLFGAPRAMFHQGAALNPMLRGPMVAYEPETGAGGGGGDEGGDDTDTDTDTDTENSEGAGTGEGEGSGDEKPKTSDKEAKLLKDVMKHKNAAKKAADDLAKANAALDKYKGVDPETVAQLISAQEEAERVAAEKRGEYDRIVAQMREQHEATVTGLQATITERDNSLAAAMSQIDDLTVGADFGNSKFLAEKTVLSPKKARALFGAHFDRVDGATVAYDKPKGAANRTPLVDANGDNLSFEAAIEKIVTGDEDFERFARSKMKPGAGSQGAQHKADETNNTSKEVSGTSRIALGLAKLGEAKK